MERRRAARLATLLAAVLLCGGVARAKAAELRADLDLLGQVRDGDQSRETEAPIDLYGRASASGLWGRSTFDSFFRLERTFGQDDGASDFYAGYARIPGALPWLDATLGRQFLSEGPGGVFVADAGMLRIDPGLPVSLSVYGGAPRYFEPTYGTDVISQDETLFGGNLRGRPWGGGLLSVNFQQQEREGRTLRQLVSATATQSLRQIVGAPSLYGTVAYDADHQNLDLIDAGFSVAAPRTRLRLTFGGSYYKPQDRDANRVEADPDRREDTIFEAFSTNELMQFRTGTTYPLTATTQLHGDYSYQRYEATQSNAENGHLGSVGLAWLPGGDGLEIVRIDYFVRDSDGGNVNGIDLSYENTVYERLSFRGAANVAYYDKASHQSDVPVSTLLGLAYDVSPRWRCEVNFEANRNERFDADLRFGFRIAYRFALEVPLPKLPKKSQREEPS